MTIGLLTSGTQRLQESAAAVADSSGNAVFDFTPPPIGYTFTGTLSCAGANVGSVFSATVGIVGGGTPWGEWGANSVYGPVQADNGQTLEVTGSGLTPGQTYQMLWIGSLDPSDQVQPIMPAANSTALTAETSVAPPAQLLAPTVVTPSGGTASTFVGPVPLNARTLILEIDQFEPPTNVSVFGTTSEIYYLQRGAYLGNFGPPVGQSIFYVPISAVVDQVFAVQWDTSVSGPILSAWYDTQAYAESDFYNGSVQTVSVVLTGIGAVTMLDGPFRLLTAEIIGFQSGAELQLVTPTDTDFLLYAFPGVAMSTTFPDNTIVAVGSSVVVRQESAGSSRGILTYAWP